MVPTTKLIKIKNHPLYPKCVSLFFVGPIFCNLASLGDNFQKLNIINFLYWFWTFKMMEHHRKFNFQNYLSKYFSKNWFCIPSSNFTRLALDRPLHAPFHFTHLTFFVAFLIKIMIFFPLCNNLDQLCMVVRYVHCTYEISKVSYKIAKTPKVLDWAYTPLFNNILYKHIAAHFLLHKIILFSQKKQCTVCSQSPKLYQMTS